MNSKKPQGNLAILTPGLGAVSTTLAAGVEMIRRGKVAAIGSVTQLGTARIGKRDEHKYVAIKDLVPLASLDDLVFGSWDVLNETGDVVAERSKVLNRQDMEFVRPFLKTLKPKKGIHDADLVKRIKADHVKTEKTAREKIEALRQDIRDFKKELNAKRAVMIHCTSTEGFRPPSNLPTSFKDFEKLVDKNDALISPSMMYCYASIAEGVPFMNGTPNTCAELPALQEYARAQCVPIAGKDLKTGQTMLKTVLAPAIKARMLGLAGWYSTNILGNRDGEVLDDPAAFKAKALTKEAVLETILERDLYPDLYKSYHHKVSIHYYPPRGDDKEGWDNIDVFGWMGYPMQLKVNFLCKDSILAAPLVLDLALFGDLAHRLEWRGIQEWLSFYFKSPMVKPGLEIENDHFIQQTKLKNTLRAIAGEELITHLGLDYYADDLPLPNKT
jgi:myo-inositol-1-phosphate synthase